MLRAAAPVLLLLLCLTAATPWTAAAQVHRCETADGRTIYTDKACQDIGAADRLPRGEAAAGASLHRRTCNRTLQDLTLELTMAIDARDANRLAALYHWPGIGTRSGYAIMERLDAVAQRPLVDARPLFPEDVPAVTSTPLPAPAPGTAATAGPEAAHPPSSVELMRRSSPWRPSTMALARSGETPTTAAHAPVAEAAPQPPRRRVPYALQVDQTLAGGSTPSRTVFGLRRHLDCWWISF